MKTRIQLLRFFLGIVSITSLLMALYVAYILALGSENFITEFSISLISPTSLASLTSPYSPISFQFSAILIWVLFIDSFFLHVTKFRRYITLLYAVIICFQIYITIQLFNQSNQSPEDMLRSLFLLRLYCLGIWLIITTLYLSIIRNLNKSSTL